jgi:hypothetical protein
MNTDYWWNDTYRRETKHSEKNLSLNYFVHQESHVVWPGIEPDSAVRGWQLTALTTERPHV